MSASQASLFGASTEPAEPLAAINADLLVRAKVVPGLAGRDLILGAGPAGARLAVVGESPGAPDVASGKPFMGPAGQMLDRMLAAINQPREQVYMTNSVKIVCSGDEITPEVFSFFIPFLHRELIAVGARVVIAFGNTATRAILGIRKSITQARGEPREFHGMTVVPTFNPAYLLRDPSRKREAWADLKLVHSLLDRA